MSSLVLELQQETLNSQSRITDILRKALVVSNKLGIDDLTSWAKNELAGYEKGADIPSYRKVKGRLMAHNPYHGWIPVIMEDSSSAKSLSERPIGQPISELEALCIDKDKGGLLTIPLAHELLMELFGDTEEFRLGMIPTLVVGRSSLNGVLDAVRNEILNWSLDLEKNGILGEGMTFSKEEIQRADSATYNIQSFQGVLGSVSNSSVQVGDYASVHQQLKDNGISQSERNELENILDAVKTEKPEEKNGLIQKGLDWVRRNGAGIGALSETIRGWFESLS